MYKLSLGFRYRVKVSIRLRGCGFFGVGGFEILGLFLGFRFGFRFRGMFVCRVYLFSVVVLLSGFWW